MNHFLVYLTFFYILGIISGYKFPAFLTIYYIIFSIFLLLLIYFPAKKLSGNSNLIKFFIIFLIAIFVGNLSYKFHTEIHQKNHVKYFVEEKPKEVYITGRIIDDPEINEDTGKSYITIEVDRIVYNTSGAGQELEVKGLIKVTIQAVLPEGNFNYGDEIRIKGDLYKPREPSNPGEFDYRSYLANKKIFALCFVNSGKNHYMEKVKPDNFKNPFLSFAYKIKHYIVGIIYRTMPKKNGNTIWSQSLVQGNLLEGVLLGNRILPKEYADMFRDTGTMHILAVSGFNVSFVVFIFFTVLRAFYVPKKISAIISIIFIILFAAITGFTPSVVRASIMAIVVLLAMIIERDTDIFNTIAFSALIILIIAPLDLFDIGFQLSYVATIGIVYLTPFIIEKLYFLPKFISGSIGISIGAQLAIVPLLVTYFNRLSIVSILTNIIIVPLVGLSTVLGFLTFFVSFILPLAGFVGMINWFFLTLLLEIISFFSKIPYASILIPSFSFISIVIYYVILIIIRNYSKILNYSVKFKYSILIIPAIIIVIILFIHPWNKSNEHTLKITFLNLKRTYSQYIEFPDKSNMLIGAGSSFFIDHGERIVAPFILKIKKKKLIDNVIVAGTRASDCGGLYYILNNFRVKNLFILNNTSKKYSKAFFELLELVKIKKIPIKNLYHGDNINKYAGICYNDKKSEILIKYGMATFYLPSFHKKYMKAQDNAFEISTDGNYFGSIAK